MPRSQGKNVNKKFSELPQIIQDLLKLGLGFYVAIAAIATFANWNTLDRLAVIIVLLAGLVIVLILEFLAGALAWFVFRPRSPKDSKSGK
jgi:CBS domain containing-hemolysin-like protein